MANYEELYSSKSGQLKSKVRGTDGDLESVNLTTQIYFDSESTSVTGSVVVSVVGAIGDLVQDSLIGDNTTLIVTDKSIYEVGE